MEEATSSKQGLNMARNLFTYISAFNLQNSQMEEVSSTRQELNIATNIKTECSAPPLPKTTEITTEKLVNCDMAQFYEKDVFSDVTFILNGYERVYAHKVILASRCEYFKSLLYEDTTQSILHIPDISSKAFREILKYIYTGRLTVDSSNGELIFEVYTFANKYFVNNIGLSEKMDSILDVNNVCAILNKANMHDSTELREKCHAFMDRNPEIWENDTLNGLTQISMVKFLERDSLSLPEIEIFRVAEKWCRVNRDYEGLVINCIRFSLLTLDEIFSAVWPSKLIDNDKLMAEIDKKRGEKFQHPQQRCRNAVSSNVNVKSELTKEKAGVNLEKNLATQSIAKITGNKTSASMTGNKHLTKYVSHTIGGKNFIIQALGIGTTFNHIKIHVKATKSGEGTNKNFHRYYIEISNDKVHWKNILDYRKYDCRSHQNLYFETQRAQFIRIVQITEPYFEIKNLEINYNSKIPQTLNQIVRPTKNVAAVSKGAIVIEGKRPKNLFERDPAKYTFHATNGGCIIVQLAQPYMISNIKLKLINNTRTVAQVSYSYLIETSVDKTNWEVAVDRRNRKCAGLQNLQFEERPTVYIKITGVQKLKGKSFCCNRFECFWKTNTTVTSIFTVQDRCEQLGLVYRSFINPR